MTFIKLSLNNADQLFNIYNKYNYKDSIKEISFPEKILQNIANNANCEINIFLVKSDNKIGQWIAKNNINTYLESLTNKQIYMYLIIDERCEYFKNINNAIKKIFCYIKKERINSGAKRFNDY